MHRGLLWIFGIVAATVLIAGSGFAWSARGASARGNASASSATGATNHTVNVSGHGEVSVAPDMALLTVGVQTKGTDAESALSANSTRTQAVITAVEGEGLASDHIQTGSISLWYDSEHNVYYASHQLTLRVTTISKVGEILDAAVHAGANNSWGVSFGLKDSSSARSQALRAAVGDARKRADSISSALGVSITGVGSASEASFNGPIYSTDTRNAAPAAPAPSTQIQPGQLTVSADISVTYTFG